MAAQNRAAWIMEPKGKPFKVDNAELPKAGPNEVIIKNHAVAVNPVDWKVQDFGIIIKDYPNVLGTDVAGEVYEVGQGVTHVTKGDRVIGHCVGLSTNQPKNGGYQLYTSCNGHLVSKIPSFLSFTDAAVLPLSVSTAVLCLFKKETLALPLPSASIQGKDSGKSILVWGGSSSIGASAIQLAVGAGVKVVSVCSKKNIEKVKDLGASEVFDYNSSGVANDIVKALSGTEYLGVCDCIGTKESAAAWTPIFNKYGGRYGSVTFNPPGIPDGIEGGFVFATTIATADKNIGEAVWGKYIPEALEKGMFRAKPEPTVIKGGLEKCQEGVDQVKSGMSFGKIVIEL